MSGIGIILTVVVLVCVFIFAVLLVVYLNSKKNDSIVNEDSAEEPKLNISEPVLSFIQEVKNNPKRFRLKQIKPDTQEDYPYTMIKSSLPTEDFYQLKDKDTLEVWDVSIEHSHYMHRSRTYKFPAWLTYDECKLIHSTFYEIYEARKKKIKERELERKERKNKQERDRLKLVYCNK